MREKVRAAYYIASFSIVANILLFVLKYWAGWKYNSVAMRADAWHTLSDTITSAIVIFGIWASSLPADREHPFGHGRAEEIAAIVLSTLLLVVGFQFLWQACNKLYAHEGAGYSMEAILIFLASAGIKEVMAVLSMKVGNRMEFSSLVADAWHHRSDSLASVAIAVAIFLGREHWWVDGVMGLAVSLFIIYIGYHIMRGVVSSIMGEGVEEGMRRRIEEIIVSIAPMVRDIHHFHIHRYGGHVEITFHIRLPPEMKLREVHDIVDEIERTLRKEMGMEATVHVDPAGE